VERDVTIARRLTLIVVSDFLCWFPVGLLGMMAATGHHVPVEVSGQHRVLLIKGSNKGREVEVLPLLLPFIPSCQQLLILFYTFYH
jgi:hypothetical protein